MNGAWKKYAAMALCACAVLAGIPAHAANDASMPNVVQAIRETDNLLGMVRGMLSMVESDIAAARGRAGAPIKDMETDRETALRMIEGLTRERARLQAIVDAWGEAFDANFRLGTLRGQLNETRSRLLTWGPRNPDGSINQWYARGDIARMRDEVAQMEAEEAKQKKAAEEAQKKFEDLMKKNAAKEAADAQLRAGTEALKREMAKLPDPQFWQRDLEGEPLPSNQRFGARFMLQPPPQGPRSPEITGPIDDVFPITIPIPRRLPGIAPPEPLSVPRNEPPPQLSAPQPNPDPDTLPFPRLIPIHPATEPRFPGRPRILPFKPKRIPLRIK